jgi:macrolide-specific efflux system membrane fusion protein
MFIKWLTAKLSMRNRSGRFSRSVLLAAAIAVFLSLPLAGCGLLPDEPEEETLPAITPPKLSEKPVYTVGTQTLETRIRGTGQVRSLVTEEYFFVDSGKRVKGVYVQPGDYVEEGELLAELDVSDLERDLRTRKLNFRKDELQMIEALRRADEMSPEELEQAKIDFELKREDLVRLEEQIERSKIRAKFSGHIVKVNIKEGDTVQEYNTVITQADLTKLVASAEIKKDDAQKIAVGMEADVSINAAGDFKGEVLRLPNFDTNQNGNNWDYWGNPNQNNQDSIDKYLLVELSPFPEGVTLGTPLSIAIVTNRKENATVIPAAALRNYSGRNYVVVEDENGTRREVDVEIGQQTATVVEIINGLEPGQKVVGR